MPTTILKRQKIAVVKPVVSTTVFPFILDRSIKSTNNAFVGRIIRPISEFSIVSFVLNFQCEVPKKINGDSSLTIEYTCRLLGGVDIVPINTNILTITPGDTSLKAYDIQFPSSDNTVLSVTVSAKNNTSLSTYMNKITLAYLEMKEE